MLLEREMGVEIPGEVLPQPAQLIRIRRMLTEGGTAAIEVDVVPSQAPDRLGVEGRMRLHDRRLRAHGIARTGKRCATIAPWSRRAPTQVGGGAFDMGTACNREEELELVGRWIDHGDRRARDQLVAAHQPMIRRQARRYRTRGCAEADLVQEGNMGLLHALSRFDPQRGVRLASYAAWWIRAYILRYIERNGRLLRGTTTAARLRLFYQLGRAKQVLATEGKDADAPAIAALLGVDEGDVTAMELLLAPVASLDTQATDSGARVLDRIASELPSPEHTTETEEFSRTFRHALDAYGRTLGESARTVYHERVLGRPPVSADALGQRLGMTAATVRGMEHRVTVGLRRHLYREMGDSIVAALGPV